MLESCSRSEIPQHFWPASLPGQSMRLWPEKALEPKMQGEVVGTGVNWKGKVEGVISRTQ